MDDKTENSNTEEVGERRRSEVGEREEVVVVEEEKNPNKRKRTSSPEKPGQVSQTRTGLLAKKADGALEEIDKYLGRNFSMDKHGVYLGARRDKVRQCIREMREENEKITGWLDKALTISGGGGIDEVDLDAKLTDFGSWFMEKVREENQALYEKIMTDAKRMEEIKVANDEQRSRDLEKINESVKATIRDMRRTMEEELRKIREEVGTSSLEEKFHRNLVEQKKVTENWDKLQRQLKEIEHKVKEVEGRNTDTSGLKEMALGLKRLEDRMSKLEIPPARSEMGELRGMLREEMQIITDKVAEGGRNVEEEMEVEGEKEVPWSSVVGRRKMNRIRKRGPQVVVEPPEKVDYEEARSELLNCLDPKESSLRVKGIRKYGERFIIEVHDEEDMQSLRRNPGLAKSGFRLDGEPDMRRPRLIVYDVERDMGEEDIIKAVRNKNRELMEGLTEEQFKEEFILKFRQGPKEGPVVNWVVEASPRVFRRVIRKERIYIGLRSCRAREYLGLSRCFKCQAFGHIGKFCNRKAACSRCGEEGHHTGQCKEKSGQRRCVNCRRAGMKEVNHAVGWLGCPALQGQRRRLVERTLYDDKR